MTFYSLQFLQQAYEQTIDRESEVIMKNVSGCRWVVALLAVGAIAGEAEGQVQLQLTANKTEILPLEPIGIETTLEYEGAGELQLSNPGLVLIGGSSELFVRHESGPFYPVLTPQANVTIVEGELSPGGSTSRRNSLLFARWSGDLFPYVFLRPGRYQLLRMHYLQPDEPVTSNVVTVTVSETVPEDAGAMDAYQQVADAFHGSKEVHAIEKAIAELEALRAGYPQSGYSRIAQESLEILSELRRHANEATLRNPVADQVSAESRALATPYIDEGEAALAAGNPGEAETAFRESLKYDPANSSVWERLGDIALHRSDRRSAFRYYRRSLMITPSNRELAQKLIELGN